MENGNIRDFGAAKDDSIESISNDDNTSRTLEAKKMDTGKNSQTATTTAAADMSNCGAMFAEQQEQKQQSAEQKQMDEQIANKTDEEPKVAAPIATAAAAAPTVSFTVAGAVNKNKNNNGKVDEKETLGMPPNAKRCDKCGKKYGLTGGFPCRCGGIYCVFHRYSDRHECNFDYREMGASEIRRENPLIVPAKLRKL